MRRSAILAILAFVAMTVFSPVPEIHAQDGPAWALVIHGGAGTIRRENMTSEREAEIRGKLTEALEAGRVILEGGGSAVEAIEATIVVMEDSPLFNAGKGAVFTHEGANELDASIMDGQTLNAGAIAGVKHVKNPIRLARMVMERSDHVMFAREGAEEFALEQGVELVPTSYFHTESRWRSLQRVQEREAGRTSSVGEVEVLGTVGAVALDRKGHLAAATSTGGMTNKRFGRVGDSPIIGAGTYADDAACAISATGHGEFFIRNAVAHDICARVLYAEMSIREASESVVMEKLVEQDASGGVIALGADGSFATPFNSEGMYRGWVTPTTDPVTAIYGDEPR